MQVKKEEIKRKIYNSALEVFKEKSYLNTTMAEISKRSGIPIGNIYRYFEKKEILYAYIVFDIYSTIKYIHIHEDFGQITSDFTSKHRRFLNAYIQLATSKPIEFHILFDSSA